MEQQTTKQPSSTPKEKAHQMIGRYKDSKNKKKEAHWVEYDANELREILKDESIIAVKFITAAYVDNDAKKDQPTILLQLKRDAITASFMYVDAPRRICPPPDGTCDSGGSFEI